MRGSSSAGAMRAASRPHRTQGSPSHAAARGPPSSSSRTRCSSSQSRRGLAGRSRCERPSEQPSRARHHHDCASRVSYTEQDQELLAFVGQHVGAALSRARAIEETRQRNAELALINSVQAALAGELELQAIYDVVGDKIQEIFDAQGSASRRRRDDRARELPVPDRARRAASAEPVRWTGFTQARPRDAEPLMINENAATEGERYGSYLVAGEWPKSLLFVPLITGDRATASCRSRTTTASTRSTTPTAPADDARREPERGARERAAGPRDAAAERRAGADQQRPGGARRRARDAGDLRRRRRQDQEIFDAQGVDIGIFDEAAGIIHFPYVIERGERMHDEPIG